MECEVCGQNYPPATLRYVSIEGATLHACTNCARKGTPAKPPPLPMSRISRRSPNSLRQGPRLPVFKPRPVEEVEVVEDYAERIREARESQGWTQQFLAHKLNERESFIKNIESGHMAPPVAVAKRLEKLLDIQLLEKPSREEVEGKVEPGSDLTLGDIVNVK